MDGYISIKEYADLTGVSVQSVYKRINKADNPIKPYVKRFNKKQYIHKSALDNLTTEEAPKEETKKAGAGNSSETKMIDILDRQLRELREQLTQKDEQLREKDTQISNLMELLNQQQKLTAIQVQKFAELPPPKKSFLERLFKKKETPEE